MYHRQVLRRRRERPAVLQNDAAYQSARSFPNPEDIFEFAFFQGGNGRRTDHTPVGNDTDPTDAKTLTQAIHHRQQNGDIRRIAGHHFGADWPTIAIDHHRQHHLLQFGSVILGMSVRTQRLAALAIERQGCRVHEHQRQVAEQVAATLEQMLLDQILDAARGQCPLAHWLQFFAKPGHGAIKMMQLQAVDAGDGIIYQPFLASPVGTGNEQPVQNAGEDGPLNREFETASSQKFAQNLGNFQPIPEPPEQKGAADPHTTETT